MNFKEMNSRLDNLFLGLSSFICFCDKIYVKDKKKCIVCIINWLQVQRSWINKIISMYLHSQIKNIPNILFYMERTVPRYFAIASALNCLLS